jgi:hypothetical protein
MLENMIDSPDSLWIICPQSDTKRQEQETGTDEVLTEKAVETTFRL